MDKLLNHSGVTLDSLFIDEGFHMLKGTELDKIIDLLQELTEQNTLVGLVTHNDALIQEVSGRLVIHPENSPLRTEWFSTTKLQWAG